MRRAEAEKVEDAFCEVIHMGCLMTALVAINCGSKNNVNRGSYEGKRSMSASGLNKNKKVGDKVQRASFRRYDASADRG